MPDSREFEFPEYGDCSASEKLDDLKRLLEPIDEDNQYIDVEGAKKIIATGLQSYRDTFELEEWETDDALSEIDNSNRLSTVFAALFDLICNAEYLHERIVNDNWLYCRQDRFDPDSTPYAYYCFLKQCPRCSLDHGLEGGSRGLTGARKNHKPSSHHIGEITTTAVMLFMDVLGKGSGEQLSLATISNQSHDVDSVAFNDDLLVLFEIKASPMVTFPVRAELNQPLRRQNNQGDVEEYDQHEIIDVDYTQYDLDLYLPHRDIGVPLADTSGQKWPYESICEWLGDGNNFLTFLSAWSELFHAYSIPKTEREGWQEKLGYLTNGWGDKIDSNKTKPGLCRTDDIKKGTYQMLKYGAYYRDGSPDLEIRSSLLANMDPVFMREEYIVKLVDVRWARERAFSEVNDANSGESDGDVKYVIGDDELYYLYDSLFAFNRPVINDDLMGEIFSFEQTNDAIVTNNMDTLLSNWQ
jgi:hypothetical protein